MADKKYKLTFKLSDGREKTVEFTAPQGKDGAAGYTPVKGTDYWTEADKKEINADSQAYIAEEMAKRGHLKPEFANTVAELEASGDTTKLYVLPDGYIYAYFVGETVTSPDTTVEITNGMKIDSSTGEETTGASMYSASNYIEIVDGFDYTVIRAAGHSFSVMGCKVCYYDANKSFMETSGDVISQDGIETQVSAQIPIIDGAKYFRLRIYGTASLTTNETFTVRAKYTGVVSKNGWASTGHAFVPADYEDRIVSLETDVTALKETTAETERAVSELKEAIGIPDTTLTIIDGNTLDKTTGVVSSDTRYSVSGYIPIVDGYTYEVTRASNMYHMSVGVGYYDENKNYLSGKYQDSVIPSASQATPSDTIATIPTVQGAAYFRLRIFTGANSAIGVITLTAKQSGGGSGSKSESDVPDYVVAEANRVISEVVKKQTGNTLTFLAISDMHNLESNGNIKAGNYHMGQAAKIISDSIGLDFAAMLGDISWGASVSTYPDQNINDILKANQYIADAFKGVDNFRTNGNHDPLTVLEDGANGNLTQGQMYALIGRYNHAGKSYFYRDYEGKKVRVIMLNTVDENNNGGSGMTAAQLLWFAQSLDLSGKSDASDWQILILSHHPLDWNQYSWGTNLMNAANILAAYLAGSSVTFTEDGVTNSYNFSGKNDATIIGQIHGHLHNYKVDNIYSTLSGTIKPTAAKRIAIPNACYDRNNTYASEASESLNGIDYGEFAADGTTPLTYSKTSGTAEDTAFCVVTIDLDEKKIYAHHYGAGYDREISYA